MTTLVLIVWLLLSVGLLFVTAIRPLRTSHSLFELKRRGDGVTLDRERLLGDIYAFRRMTAVVLVMALTVTGWLLWQERGVIAVLVVLPCIMLLSRWAPIARWAMQFYAGQEKSLLGFAARWPTLGWLLGSDRRLTHDQKLESPEHLLHLVESAGHVLSADQQLLIKRGLDWHTTTVVSMMTPAKDIVSIPRGELLGPLVLDDLHKSGYHRFPVVRGDVDHVIGMVNITELLRVDAVQKSVTAEKVMDPLDIRVGPDAELPDVLKQLLAHPGQLGLVVEDEKTIGLITLNDVLKSLLG